jgi:two-component system, OmpR family, osmolarity sensor histidine kinase EnvZ
MRLWPRTLFWRVFVTQLLLMAMIVALLTAFIARDQARTSAQNIAAVWAPALREALDGAGTSGPLTLRVSREVSVLQQAPPAEAYTPWASPRFASLVSALQAEGIPVHSIAVSGVTDESVVWVQVQAGTSERWLGVASNLEGEDFPKRVLWLSVVGLALTVLLAFAMSRMVAAPARRLALAVQAYGQGYTLPSLPTNAPAEINSLIRSVTETFAQRGALEAQRSLMLAGLSHDVRSPLARIRLATEMLPEDHSETAELKDRIARNVLVLDRLVASFADYVRASEGALDSVVDLAHVAAEAVAAFNLPDAALSVHGSTRVLSHADLLRRALDNLIDNALRHGSAPISVAVQGRAGTVTVEVRNAGASIEPAEVPRLMQPFERGQAGRGVPGSGLGLAIVQTIALRHGGSFVLEPVDGSQGTRAVLRLVALAA